LLAVTLALLPGGFQFAVAFCVDLVLTPRQHVFRRVTAPRSTVASSARELFSS
jgi:hypothetical protein